MIVPADLVAQHRYVRSARQFHPGASLAIGSTILRGLRDLGYRDSPAAIAALVDNALDARARTIDVVVEGTRHATAIAVIDNGFGMVREMIRAACALGATCPLGEGPHLARSGFGLPAAPFAIGRRFDLISAPSGSPLAQVTMDLDRVNQGDEAIPEPHAAILPDFVVAHIHQHAPAWNSGTIVVIRDLDRASISSAAALRERLADHLGYVFQHFMPGVTIRVDGVPVIPIDPLFVTPGTLGYDLDEQRAEFAAVGRYAIDESAVTLRSAVLPPSFASIDKRKDASGKNGNSRGRIVRDVQGIVVSRLGRRLTVLPDCPFTSFTPGDRYIRMELDFPAELDEVLAPSLSLQQVQIASSFWESLRAAGFAQQINHLRSRLRQLRMQGADRADSGMRLAEQH